MSVQNVSQMTRRYRTKDILSESVFEKCPNYVRSRDRGCLMNFI